MDRNRICKIRVYLFSRKTKYFYFISFVLWPIVAVACLYFWLVFQRSVFESQPGDLQSWLKFLVAFFIFYRKQKPGYLSGISLGYGLDVFESRQGLGIFLYNTMSRPSLGPTQPPIQWVPGALSLGVKRPGREPDHSPLSSAEVKNVLRYTSTPPIRLHGVVLS
jgi:hypothetical protein